MEVRYSQTEVRAEDNKIVGYASVFYDGTPATEYQLWRGAVERIHPDAFNRAINEKHDVRALLNHDANFILGRTASGTLTLAVDKKGLRYEIPYDPNDEDHRRTKAKIARGDINSSSFAFRVTGEEWRTEGDMEVRTVKDVELIDVSPVVFPAYSGATAGLRSESNPDEAKQSHEKWKAKQETMAMIRNLDTLPKY